jgi:hypothetical protein
MIALSPSVVGGRAAGEVLINTAQYHRRVVIGFSRIRRSC